MRDYIKELRKLIGNMKIVIPGVRALIFNHRGDLLMLKRGDFLNWALPGGCVDVGESAFDAIRREVKEETGLSISWAKPFGLYSDPKYCVTYPNGDQVQTFTLAFLVEEWSGEMTADGKEAVNLGFFSLKHLPDQIYPVHIETISDYKSHNGSFILK